MKTLSEVLSNSVSEICAATDREAPIGISAMVVNMPESVVRAAMDAQLTESVLKLVVEKDSKFFDSFSLPGLNISSNEFDKLTRPNRKRIWRAVDSIHKSYKRESKGGSAIEMENLFKKGASEDMDPMSMLKMIQSMGKDNAIVKTALTYVRENQAKFPEIQKKLLKHLRDTLKKFGINRTNLWSFVTELVKGVPIANEHFHLIEKQDVLDSIFGKKLTQEEKQSELRKDTLLNSISNFSL